MTSAMGLPVDKRETLKDAITLFSLKMNRDVWSFGGTKEVNTMLEVLGCPDLTWFKVDAEGKKVSFAVTTINSETVTIIFAGEVEVNTALKGVQDTFFIPADSIVLIVSEHEVTKYITGVDGLVYNTSFSFDYFFKLCNLYRAEDEGFLVDGGIDLSNVHHEVYFPFNALSAYTITRGDFLVRNNVINLYSGVDEPLFEEYWSSSDYVKTMLHNILYSKGFDARATKTDVSEYIGQVRHFLIKYTVAEVSSLLPKGFSDAVERGIANISDDTLVDMIEYQWSLYVGKGESRLLTVV